MPGVATIQLAASERLAVQAPDFGSVEVRIAQSGQELQLLDRYKGDFSVGPYRYQMTVQLSATGGDGEYSVLNATGVVTSGPLVIGDNEVSVIGSKTVGSVLRAKVAAGYEVSGYQWLRDGVNISGATSGTYTLTSSDQGKTISVRTTLSSLVAGGFSVPPAPPSPVSLLARVLGFGDSTMFGIDGNTASQAAAGSRALNIFAAARGLPAYNAAVSGTVLQDGNDSGGSPRAQNGYSRYVADTLGANASQVVVCNYGLNDLRYTAAPATLNLANFLARYATIVDAWKAAGIEVILASPCWIPDAGYSTGSAGFTGSNRTLHEQYVAGIWQLAKDKGVKYADSYERMKAIGATSVGSDNIHPTTAIGYASMAQSYIAAAVPTESSWPGAAVDVTAPTLVSAVVPSGSPNKVVLTYSEALSATLTGSATVGGPARTVTGSAVVGTTVEITVNTPYAFGDAPTVTTPAGFARDPSGNQAAALVAQAVTNNVPSGAGAAAVTFSSTNANWRTVATERYDSSIGTSTFDGIAQVTGSVAVGAEAWVEMQHPNTTDAGGLIALDPNTGLRPFTDNADRAYLVQLVQAGTVLQSSASAPSTTATGYAFPSASAQNRVRLRVSAGGTVTVDTTTDDGSNWTTRHTFAGTASGTLYFKLYASNARDIYQPRQFGVA